MLTTRVGAVLQFWSGSTGDKANCTLKPSTGVVEWCCTAAGNGLSGCGASWISVGVNAYFARNGALLST